MIFNGSFKTHEVLKDTRFPVSGKSPDTRLHNHCPVPLFKIQCATEQKNRRIVMTYQIDTFYVWAFIRCSKNHGKTIVHQIFQKIQTKLIDLRKRALFSRKWGKKGYVHQEKKK